MSKGIIGVTVGTPINPEKFRASPEEIQAAVEAYLAENPVEGGVGSRWFYGEIGRGHTGILTMFDASEVPGSKDGDFYLDTATKTVYKSNGTKFVFVTIINAHLSVKYSTQDASEEQKAQARANIGAVSRAEINDAVSAGIDEAKANGEFDGKDGKDGAQWFFGTDFDAEIIYPVTNAKKGDLYVNTNTNNVYQLGDSKWTYKANIQGASGTSPTISVADITDGHKLTITDKNGTKTVNVLNGAKGDPGVPASHVWNGTTLVVTSSSGTSSANLKGDPGTPGNPGERGEQGYSILRITTAPSSYTTTQGGFTPKYKIALSTVLSESGASEVRVGDTILRNYYTYRVGYVDSSNVYVGTYASIRGTAGTTPKKGEDYWTEDDKQEILEEFAELAASVEPADDDIPKVFLTGNEFSSMTIDKNEVNMEMEYRSKTKQFHAYIGIKFQGNSSLNYDKKNFTVKLYDDEAHESKQKHLFRDWKDEKNKFVLKANYIDHSHARNIVSANLWDEVVSSRSDYNTLPAELRSSPKNGAIDGFPIKLYVNGTYQGVYTWNIGKDDWMWGMDEDNPNHILLCVEQNTDGEFKLRAYNFRALWNGTDGYFEVEVGTAGTAVTNAINNLISFVMNNDGSAFRNGIGTYLDVQSAIDYYLHQYIISGLDGLAKNMLLGTYDGKKWYCGAYDMDSTFGLFWNGTKFTEANYKCPEDYQEKFNLLWERLESNYWSEIKSRYAELRQNVYSVSNMFTHFERFTDSIGNDLYTEDLEIYPSIPSGSTNNIKQLRNFIRDRLTYCDQQITNGIPGTGVTLSKTTLSLNSDAVTLKATVTPSNTTDSVLWITSNPAVATVNNGVVTPVSDGTCTIRAKCGSGYATCEVTVAIVVEPSYINLLDSALDPDTKTNTGTRYKAGYRVSSSGAIKTGSASAVCSGFMKVSSGATIRIKGVTMFTGGSDSDRAIGLFKSDFTHLGTACFQGSDYTQATTNQLFGTANISPITSIANGITTIKLPTSSDIYYLVVSGTGSGANMIVTADQGIV